jgi:hypothetical protein
MYAGQVVWKDQVQGQEPQLQMHVPTCGAALLPMPLPTSLHGDDSELGRTLHARLHSDSAFANGIIGEAQFQCDVTGASDTSLRVVPDWVLDMQRNVVSITGWLVVVEPVACILTSSFDMPVGSDDYSQVRTML